MALLITKRQLFRAAFNAIHNPPNATDQVKASKNNQVEKNKMVKELTPFLMYLYKKYMDAKVTESVGNFVTLVIEDINIPINIGDTVLGGKFKNKRIVVKSIGKNEKGDITINDKPLLKYRLVGEGKKDPKYKEVEPTPAAPQGYKSPIDVQDELEEGVYSQSALNNMHRKSRTEKYFLTDETGDILTSPYTLKTPASVQNTFKIAREWGHFMNRKVPKFINVHDLKKDGKVVDQYEWTDRGIFRTSIDSKYINYKNIDKQLNSESVSEANAVSGSKIHQFITGNNLTLKGKKYNQIEFEVLSTDNKSQLVKLRVLFPKNLAGQELNVPFKTIRRGPFIKTNTKGQFEVTEDLRNWFGKGKTGSTDGGGWDRYGTDGQKLGKCGDGEEGDAYAACLSKEKAAKLGPDGRAAFVRRKRADQKKAGDAKKGGEQKKGQKPTFSKTGASEGVVNEIPMADLKQIDQFADKQLNPVDVVLTDKHFFDRLNDPRNGKEISNAELIGFFKRLAKHKKEFVEFLEKYKEVVATDDRTNINIPFMKQSNKAIAKTIMRKNDFKTSGEKLEF